MTRPLPLAPRKPRPMPGRAALAPVAAVLFLLAGPAPAAAQSKSDAFAGKIPPVSAALYRKAGRFEASLSANFSLNDPFYTKYFAGLKLDYHFTETLSAGFGAVWSATSLAPRNEGPHLATDLGGGVRFYPKEWLAFDLGLSATLYPDQPIKSVPGTVQKVFAANLGFSFFFPTSFEYVYP